MTSIDQRNRILQARKATIDAEVKLFEDLLSESKELREKWAPIIQEAVLIADGLGIDSSLPEKRQRARKRLYEDADSTVDVEAPARAVIEGESFATTIFRVGVFYRLIDAVIQRLACRFEFVKLIDNLFGFLYKYKTMTEVDLKLSYDPRFSAAYFEDVYDELSLHACQRKYILMLLQIRHVNLYRYQRATKSLRAFEQTHLEALFPNLCVSLRIFCTLPVTVASAERSFCQLK